MATLAVAAGAMLIGVALGLLGGGGTILTVPMVRALLGVDTRHAVAISLPVVAIAAGAGAFAGWRRGAIAIRPTLAMASVTTTGSYLGARLAHLMSTETQTLLLGITLICAAALTWRRGRAASSEPAATGQSPYLLAMTGVGVGLLTGVVGVGGGFLLVPALVAVGGYSVAEAVPTSLFVIAMSASGAAVGYRDVPAPWATVALVAGAAVVGVIVGGRTGHRLKPATLQAALSVVLVAAAGYLFATR